MENDELKTIWIQHEKMLLENTRINKALLLKLLSEKVGKRVDWLKVKSLAGLILPILLIIFIVIPRMQFTFEPDVVIGIVLFVSLSILTYIWAIKLYLLIEKINPNAPLTAVRKQLKLVEKYKLKTTRNSLSLAPLMIVGIFLAAGIPFVSARMIPFYVLMLIVFLLSTYIRSKHGLVAQVRKLDRDIEEIAKLEMEHSKA